MLAHAVMLAAMLNLNTPDLSVPGHYVFDRFGTSQVDAYVSGPFTTLLAADQDRRERNAGDDYVIFERTPEGTWR